MKLTASANELTVADVKLMSSVQSQGSMRSWLFFFFSYWSCCGFPLARWASHLPSRHSVQVNVNNKEKHSIFMWKLFYSGFISKQIKVAYCRCAVTNEFIHKCWVCFGNKCCFVFFICNKTFIALLPNDQPACVMIFRKDLHLVY